MFDTVLVANRGEIAARIIRTLRRMGIRSVAVYSDADAGAPFVALADHAVRIGPAPASQSYLNVDGLIDAALATGSQAVHPGYGFLSENSRLAQACVDAGITFIGPPIGVLQQMGDKIAAKKLAIAADVPVVPGRHDDRMDDSALAQAIGEIGMPVILKPSAGGGGKGMVIVRSDAEIAEALAGARRIARAAFGDERLLVERYIDRPRHIEVQVLADAHGNVVHLGERECTLQRRHQKVIEEAPSPFLDATSRTAVCDSAVRLASSVGYVGAGTVEYVVPGDNPAAFAFLEMNTRLQVEHPVTELVTGLDLVEWQVRIAAGERLDFGQGDVSMTGHAIEARVYAEDPAHDFLPTGGEILLWSTPDTVRVDSGVATGVVVSTDYDPMLAKVIAHGPTRAEAMSMLRDGLDGTVALGVTTNIEFARDLLADPDVVNGDLDTGLIDRFLREWSPAPVDEPVRLWAALAAAPAVGIDPFHVGDSWRLGGAVPVRRDVDGVEVEIEPGARLPREITARRAGDVVWLHAPGVGNRRFTVTRPIDRRLRASQDRGAEGAWVARSPMPGTIVALAVKVGDRVSTDDPVVVVEAMKMEHTLRAASTGIVSDVRVSLGDQVRLDDILVCVEPAGES